ISSSATPEASTSSISFLSLRISTGVSLKVFDGGVQGQPVAVGAQTGDGADGDVGKIGMLTEWFARGDVGQVNVDKRQSRAQQGIAQRDAGVGVGSRVEQDAVRVFVTCGVNTVDQCTFTVALKAGQLVATRLRLLTQCLFDVRQRLRAIQTRLACSEQVQIGTIY